MRNTLLIRVYNLPSAYSSTGGDFPEASWLAVDAQGNTQSNTGASQQGSLVEAASQATGKRVVVLLPSTDVLHTIADVPKGSQQQLARAIPYALEEQLAEDVDSLHFAVGQRSTAGLQVAVIARTRLEQHLLNLEQAGLTPDAVYADAAALPLPESDSEGNTETDSALSASVLVEQDNSLVHCSDGNTSSLDSSWTDEWLQACLPAQGRVDLYSAPGSNSQVATLAESSIAAGLNLKQHPAEDSLHLLLRGLNDSKNLRNAVNLLQGDYAKQSELMPWLKPLRAAAVLLLCLMIAATASKAIELNQRQAQQSQLRSQLDQIFLSAFPGRTRVQDAVVEMQQALSRLQSTNGAGDAAFIHLLQRSAPIIAAADKVKTRSINYRSNALEWRLEAEKVQSVDALKLKLGELAGINAELQSVDAQGDSVSFRVVLKTEGDR